MEIMVDGGADSYHHWSNVYLLVILEAVPFALAQICYASETAAKFAQRKDCKAFIKCVG